MSRQLAGGRRGAPGVPQRNPAVVVLLACGHRVLYAPPVPEPRSELTCGICGEPTEVAA